MYPTKEVQTCLDICDERQRNDVAKQRPFCVSVAVAKAAGVYHLIPDKKAGTGACGRDAFDTLRIGGESAGRDAHRLPLWKSHPGLQLWAKVFEGYYVCVGCYNRFKGSKFKASVERTWRDSDHSAGAVSTPVPLVEEQVAQELPPKPAAQEPRPQAQEQEQEQALSSPPPTEVYAEPAPAGPPNFLAASPQAAPQHQEPARPLALVELHEEEVAQELPPKPAAQEPRPQAQEQEQEQEQLPPSASLVDALAEPPAVPDLSSAGAPAPTKTASSPPPKRARMAEPPPPVALDEHPQGQQQPEEEGEDEGEGQEEEEAAEDVAELALWATVFAAVDMRVRAVLRRAKKREDELGGGAGTEGLYGSCTQRTMLNGLAFWVQHMGFGPSSVLVDMGSGLGMPGIIAVSAARVRNVYNIELDRHKFDKANSVLDAVATSSVATGAGLDFGGTHNICAPMEAFRVGVEKVKDNCNYYWAGSVGIRCLEVGTKRVTRSTTRRAPIRMVPHRVPQPTHVFTFWEGIPVAAKQHLAYLVSNTPSIKSIFIVQRGVDIVQDMAGLGFKRLVLVHQLAMTTCGAGESFKGYIFEVLPPCKGTPLAEPPVAGRIA